MIGLVLIGQSNSGKSTIGRAVAEKMNMKYISSGDIARSMSEDVQNKLNDGELAPEDAMRERIWNILWEMKRADKDFILDGFPRFQEQYKWLDDKKWSYSLHLVYVHIDVPDDDIIMRAINRGRCDDDSIIKKINYFKSHTNPMLTEIIMDTTVYYIANGNTDNVDDNITKLCNIVKEYKDANNC